MASFTVFGPLDVPYTKLPAARTIDKSDIAAFWKANPTRVNGVGVYLFGFRASKGYKPVYAGKATKSFEQEVFTDHKLKKYHTAFGSQVRGTPILFFVELKRTRGRINATAIDEVETFIIQSGLIANPKILNDRKTQVESWSIAGLVRSRGRTPAPASALSKCLKL